MTLTNFRASDFGKDGSTVRTAPSKRDRNVEPTPTSRPIVAPDASPEDVPSGTAPEILTWVGNNPVRAQKALDTELENAKPRKGLVSELQGKVDAEAEEDEPASNEGNSGFGKNKESN